MIYSRRVEMTTTTTDEHASSLTAQLQQSLDLNPYQYNLHVGLINLLRQSTESDEMNTSEPMVALRDRLSRARTTMASLYLLPPSLWLEWIGDAEDQGLPTAVLEEIYTAAVGDYTSPQVWANYLALLASEDDAVVSLEPEGLSKFRRLAQRALDTCGTLIRGGASMIHTSSSG